MTRNLTIVMLLALILGASRAEALTPGPVCREACAPRIERDCGDLSGKAFKRCRRGLVRACKASTPETACPLLGRRPDDPAGGPIGGGTSGGGDGVQGITDALADKRVTIGSSDIFSGGSITETQEMSLCRSGSALVVVTRVTSTFGLGGGNTFDSTETFEGTWRVVRRGGAPVLEIDLGEPSPRRFAIGQDGQGGLVLGDVRADVADASGPCGGTPGGGGTGTPDPAAEIARTLADHLLVLRETNLGFGTRTTAIGLCGSGRYVQDVTVSAAPGQVVETIGSWRVDLAGASAVLVLSGDDGTVVERAIGVDADGGLLLDGLVAGEGDGAALSGVCGPS